VLYFALLETTPGSGRYAIRPGPIEAPGTLAALGVVAASATAGQGYGVAPCEPIGGVLDAPAPDGTEAGESYALLIEDDPAAGIYADAAQSVESVLADAAHVALRLGAMLGHRVGLIHAS